MKQLKGRLWAKITALLLLCVFAATAFLSGVGISFLVVEDAYIDGGEHFRREVNEDMVKSCLNNVLEHYEDALHRSAQGDQYAYEFIDSFYSHAQSNLVYSIVSADGIVLYTNDSGEETKFPCSTTLPLTRYSGEPDKTTLSFQSAEERQNFIDKQYTLEGHQIRDYSFYEENDPNAANGVRYMLDVTIESFTEEEVTVYGAVASLLTAADDFRRVNYWMETLINLREVLIVTAVLSLLLCLALFVFLLSSAGHREDVDGIHLSWLSRIPFDLLTAVLVTAGFCTVCFVADSRYTVHWTVFLLLLTLGGVICLLLLMALLMSFAARAKAGSWWRGTVCWHLLHSIFRVCRWTWRTVTYPIRNLSGCWKIVAFTAAVMLLEFFLALLWGMADTLSVFWLLERIVILFLLAVFVLSFRRIESGGRALASGDLSYQIATDFMQPPFLQHARHLNAIGAGMQKAVEQQMRSERMKTELITNVSHDIKTPLTSIVNYVGLMKTLELEDETAREYLEVLDRQSARLRKLTEDLVEASKASTGNLSVTLERTDLNLLLQQASGEYEDRLHELQLEPVLRLSGEEAPILADGKLLWRVFDNLMGNICKYSLPGTRVYLSTEIRDGRVTASFKNISRYPLDISTDELMERFVRGDSSRSTEGSGLGLSIARSLTTLQGGSFGLSIDGDLFRADVGFALAE